MHQQSNTRLRLMRLCLGWTILLLSASPSFAQVTGSPSMWLNCSSHQVIYDGNAQTGGAAPSDTKLYRCRTTVLVQSNSGNLVRTGYTFAGWNTQANGNGTNYAAGTSNFKMGSTNATLYAKWAVNSYTVSYDGNTSTSGSVPSSGNYDYAATVTVAGNTGALAKTGYTFAGWNTLANGGGTSYAPNAMFAMGTANLTLYAQWTANSYIVTYNGNGSDGGSLPAASGYTYGQSYTFAAAGVTRTGYTFAGWNDAPAGTGTNYAAGVGSVLSRTSFTVYAKWTANSYTITYNGNGSDGGSLPAASGYTYGQSYTFAAAAVTKTGFTFAGWNDAADGTGTHYTAGAGSVLSRVSFTVYAKWTANSYTITYNGNGSDGGTLPTAANYTYGQSYTFAAAAVTKTGFTFAGWNDAADGTGTNYTAGVGSVLNQTSFTVYAKWTANTYTITYNGNGSDGGALPTAANYTYGQSYTFAAAGVTRTGYTFAGWNDAAAGTGTNYAAGVGSVLSRTSFTVYAKWTVNTYIITYDGNGNTGGSMPATANYNFGSTVTVAANTGALTKTGLYLVAWNTAADGTGTSYALGTGTFTMGSSNLTLYALWWTDLCPTLAGGTWVGVPGNTNHGTSDFCVMKYMATNVASKPYSQAGVGPWNGYGGVTATTAKTYCSSLGSGYHLITNPEWMTIATNIAAQTNNWSGGSVGLGSLAVGNSGSGSGSTMGACAADADDSKAWLGTSCTDRQTQGANAFIKRRTHTLSNNQVLWDMSGNAWQVVDYANASDKPAPTGESWNELSAMTGSTTSPISHLVPRASTDGWWNDNWNSTQGVGAFNPGAQGGGGQMLRGSDFSYPSSIAGIFAGWMSHAPTSGTFHAYGAQYTYPTFRCTYKPGSLVVTYNGNGHTSGTAPSDSLLYNAGEPVLTATNTGTLAKTGYTFAGWNTAADGTGTTYAANSTFAMDSSSLTLYAKWTIVNSTVTYDGNGSTGGNVPAPGNYNYGATVTVADNTQSLVKTNYYLWAWNTASNGNGTSYPLGTGSFIMGSTNITLYAQWGGIPPCGGPGDSCYSNALAMSTGVAVTPLGKNLEYVDADGAGAGTFKVWKEAGGARILGANGLDRWTRALNMNGMGQSTTDFIQAGIGTASTLIEGRVCPGNVYIDDGNPITAGNCLYYTPSYAAQVLNADGDDSGAQLGFRTWSTHTWYRGNIKRCSDKGMRLPTLYETTTPSHPGGGLPTNWTPTAWGVGVPASTFTWTSTSNISDTRHFWTWSGTSTNVVGFDAFQGRAVRCVLPDSDIPSYTVTYEANGATSGTAPTDTYAYSTGTTVKVLGNAGSLAKTGFYLAAWNTSAGGGGTSYTPATGTLTMGTANVILHAQWVAAPVCGGSNDSCYSNTAAMNAGVAVTPLGKNLLYIDADGTGSRTFKVWKESGGNRVLNPSGFDLWLKKLTLNGREQSTTDFTDANIGTTLTLIEGRVCPGQVYINDSNPLTTVNCLYYTPNYAGQSLTAAGSSQTLSGSIGLGAWDVADTGNGAGESWYEGNVQTCASKGMRLPTLYETTVSAKPATNTPSNWNPTLWGQGVPTSSWAWTSTVANYNTIGYWQWSGTTAYTANSDNNSITVKCVIPDSQTL